MRSHSWRPDHRAAVAVSEFRDAVHVALTREQAAEMFAEFLVRGDNAWADSDGGSGILSLCFWRD
jgi:hypothetical protein